MFKTKDFYLMKVYSINGKYLGVINDICINFSQGILDGFIISNYKLFNKKNFISTQDIITLEEVMVVKDLKKKSTLTFKEIKDLDIIDEGNVMRGVLEDLIIDKESLSIKGLIMSSGIFDKMLRGKEIILLKDCVLGEDFILYHGGTGVRLKALPNKKNYGIL